MQRNKFCTTALIGLAAESNSHPFLRPEEDEEQNLNVTCKTVHLLVTNENSMSANRLFQFICFSPQLQIKYKSLHSTLDGYAWYITFHSQCMDEFWIFLTTHYATDRLRSEKTFTLLTLGKQRSNTVAYLLVLKTASRILIHTWHSNNHWISL